MPSHKTFKITRFLFVSQETKAESAHSPMDSDENVIESGITPRGDIGEEPTWVCKESHMRGGSHIYAVARLPAS